MTPMRFSGPAAFAMLVIGVISGFIPALQGTLLPLLAAEGRLTLAQLGQVAMAEAIGMLIAVSVANAALRPEKLKLIVLAAAVIGLLLDLSTARLSGSAVLAARFVHGLCAGVLLWVWVGFLTRVDNPARWVAIYITAQAALLLVLSSFITAVVVPWGGAVAGFAVVAAAYGIIGAVSVVVPARFAPLIHEGGSMMPPRAGWIGLFVCFAQLAGTLAMWVYIKPYGAQLGLSAATTGLAMATGMGAMIAAGLVATALAGRVSAFVMVLVVPLLSVATLGLLLVATSAAPFIFATGAFAFLWMVLPAFHMPYLIDVDPSRRSAVHMATAQLVGVAGGPALASLAVTDGDASGAIFISAGLYMASILAVVAMRLTRRAPEALAMPAA